MSQVRVEGPNGTRIATADKLEDGYYYLSFVGNGLFTANDLRQLANQLDDLNREWNLRVVVGLEP